MSWVFSIVMIACRSVFIESFLLLVSCVSIYIVWSSTCTSSSPSHLINLLGLARSQIAFHFFEVFEVEKF